MSDAVSLASLGAAALTEGIKFLYAQAGELLKRRRDRTPSDTAGAQSTPEIVAQPALLPAADLELLVRFESELRALRTDLSEYDSGVDVVDPSDEALLLRVDALRRVLESIYGTRLVLRGEPPEPAAIVARVDADDVAGYVAAVRANGPVGDIHAYTRVRQVRAGGQVVGVDLSARQRPDA